MRINSGIRQQLLAASLGVSLLQPVALGAVGSILLGAAAGEVRAQQTLNTEAIARIAQGITVRIEGATQGSGVLVKRDGNRYTVLTAWHVVSGQRSSEELAITTVDGKLHQVEKGSIRRIGNVDLSTLTFISTDTYRLAEIQRSRTVSRGSPLTVSGFPSARHTSISINKGFAVANTELGIDNGYQLIYTTDTVAGMSGGPVLNSQGQLIAIHGRGEIDIFASSLKSNTIKTGANQGIPIDHYLFPPSQVETLNKESKSKASDDYIAQAQSVLQSESFDEQVRLHTAERLLSKAIEIEGSFEAYHLRGFIKHMLKNSDGSIEDLKRANQINPSNPRTIIALANIYQESGRRADAIQLVSSALATDSFSLSLLSDSDIGIYAFVELLVKAGEQTRALEILDGLISKTPTNAEYLIQRSVIRKRLGDRQGALADFHEASKYDSFNVHRHDFIRILEKAEGRQAVAKYYDSMIARFPRDLLLYLERSVFREEDNDLEGYYQDRLRLFEASNKEVSDYVSLAEAKIKIGDRSGAKEMLSKALPRIGNDKDSTLSSPSFWYSSIADKQKELGDIAGATRTLDTAIQRFPKEPYVYSSRALFRQYTLKDPKGALEDYKTAAILSGYGFHFVNSWASIVQDPYFDSQDERHLHSAIEIYDLGIEHNPKEGINYLFRADLREMIGDLRGALEDLSKAILIDNRYFEKRAEILLSLGRTEEAAKDIDRAIQQLDMTNVFDIIKLARLLYERLGRTQSALALLEKGIQYNQEGQYVERVFAARAEINEAIGNVLGACADHLMAISIDKSNSETSVQWLQSSKGAYCR
jgi:tetratricopeptide (TPR) repeat protein